MLRKLNMCWTFRVGIVLMAIVASGSNCGDQSQNQSGPIRLTILNAPVSVKPGEQLTLNVRTEGASGEVLYTWVKKSGPELSVPAVLPADDGNPELILTAPFPSRCGLSEHLSLRLEAKDEAGQTGSAEISVEIIDEVCGAIKLSVDNLPRHVNSGDEVKLTVTAEGYRNSPKFTWTQTEGPIVDLKGIPDASPNLSFKAPELPCGATSELKFRLDASDGSGQTGKLETGMVLDQAWCTLTRANDKLLDNKVNRLSLQRDGTLWIGTESGLNTLIGSNWVSYTSTTHGLLGNSISGLAVESDSSLWVYSLNKGLGILNPTKALQRIPGLGTPFFLNKQDQQPALAGLPSDDVLTIVPTPYRVYVGTAKGVRVFQEKDNVTLLNDKAINAIAFDVGREGQWFGGAEGIWIRKDGKDVKYFDGSQWNGLQTRNVRTIAADTTYDDHRMMFIGLSTSRGGMVAAKLTDFGFLVPSIEWKRYTTAEGMAGNDIRKIVVGDNHQVWVATSSGLSSYDPIGDAWKSYKSVDVKGMGGFTTDDITDVAYDKLNNALWIATNGGGLTRAGLNVWK